MYFTAYDIHDNVLPEAIKLLLGFILILFFAIAPVWWIRARKAHLTSADFVRWITNNEATIDVVMRYRLFLYYACLYIFILGGFLMILITIISYNTIFGEYYRLLRSESRGRMHIIEGRVENFIPYSPNGEGIDEDKESFTIKGTMFSYSPGLDTAAYHKSAEDGGCIKGGNWIRLYYINDEGLNKIVKIEIQSK